MKCAPAPGANLPACIMPAARADGDRRVLRATVRAATRSAASASRVALSSGLSGCFSIASSNAERRHACRGRRGAALFGVGFAGRRRTRRDRGRRRRRRSTRPTAKPAAAIATTAMHGQHDAQRAAATAVGRSGGVGSEQRQRLPGERLGRASSTPLLRGSRRRYSSRRRAATNASCGTSTRPICFIRFLPSFWRSSSLRFRVMSPP